jgi:hypothetical protein
VAEEIRAGGSLDTSPIKAVEISAAGELLVRMSPDPSGLYDYIYRTATGVQWDRERECFVAPKPRERSYADWFNQIVFDARSELGVTPVLDSQTVWLNVPQATHEQILVVARRG